MPAAQRTACRAGPTCQRRVARQPSFGFAGAHAQRGQEGFGPSPTGAGRADTCCASVLSEAVILPGLRAVRPGRLPTGPSTRLHSPRYRANRIAAASGGTVSSVYQAMGTLSTACSFPSLLICICTVILRYRVSTVLEVDGPAFSHGNPPRTGERNDDGSTIAYDDGNVKPGFAI